MREGLNQFADGLPPTVSLVIGGNGISSELRNGLKSVVCCDNMSQLLASTKEPRQQQSPVIELIKETAQHAFCPLITFHNLKLGPSMGKFL